MNIFQEMKERVTARQVAERYGLKVSRNGMARCPFHNDKHPSMKIDQNYYCFACGAKGDAVNYVAVLFGLSQLEAAKKINDDFSLNLSIGTSIAPVFTVDGILEGILQAGICGRGMASIICRSLTE